MKRIKRFLNNLLFRAWFRVGSYFFAHIESFEDDEGFILAVAFAKSPIGVVAKED